LGWAQNEHEPRSWASEQKFLFGKHARGSRQPPQSHFSETQFTAKPEYSESLQTGTCSMLHRESPCLGLSALWVRESIGVEYDPATSRISHTFTFGFVRLNYTAKNTAFVWPDKNFQITSA
jgi:hypothetical protein